MQMYSAKTNELLLLLLFYTTGTHVEGIDTYLMNHNLLTGTLEFRYAGYNEVSSNGWIFEKLATLLLSCLNISENNWQNEFFETILK